MRGARQPTSYRAAVGLCRNIPLPRGRLRAGPILEFQLLVVSSPRIDSAASYSSRLAFGRRTARPFGLLPASLAWAAPTPRKTCRWLNYLRRAANTSHVRLLYTLPQI